MEGSNQALEQGIRLFKEGNAADAIPLLAEAVAGDESNARAHEYLGAAFSTAGDHESAITHFEAAARLEPDQAKHFYNLGQACQAAGQNGEAEDAFRRAVRLNPESQKSKDALAALTGEPVAPAPTAAGAAAAWVKPPQPERPPDAPEKPAEAPAHYAWPESMKSSARRQSVRVPSGLIILLIAVAVAALGYFVVLPRLAGDPAKVVQEFADAQKTMDFDAMAKVVSEASQERVTSMKAQLGANPMARQAMSILANAKLEAGQATISGSEAQVPLKVSLSTGGSSIEQTQTVWCIKERGGWKIDVPKTEAEQLKNMKDLLKGGRP